MDIDSLTIEQYLMLTEGKQTLGIGKPEFRRAIKKNIEEMTIAEYIEYESLEEDIDFVSEEESEIGEQGVDEGWDTLGDLPCQLPPKELNPRSFTLPCTIGNLNLYVVVDLGASVNVMPKSIFEHLKLASFKETNMVVEMEDMTKIAPLGIVENILVKIDKFLFPYDSVIIDMLGEPKETMILGRPFLATTHAQIDVFKREISLGIREDRVKSDMDGGISHSRIPVEKIYMESSVHEEDYFNPLEIKNDVFSYGSLACLLFEQHTKSYDNKSVDTLDSASSIQGLKDKDVVRYRSKSIDDTTRERRYYEWVAQNTEFEDNDIPKETIKDYSYEEWLRLKLGHINVSKSVRNAVLNEWVLDSFNVETDYGKTHDKPYSRTFDEYKGVFDNKIEQLGNEYDLRIGKKGYDLDDVWYSFEGGGSFVCITKQLDGALPLGRVNGSRFMGMIRKEMDEDEKA
ncbi:phospholipase-like protein [Tanacetum coccineum]